MGGPVPAGEARGVLGPLRRLLHARNRSAEVRRLVLSGASLASLVLLASLALAACSACDGKPAGGDAPSGQSSQQAASLQETAPPAVENPTPVGQAVDAIARPAITEVLGQPALTRASETEALIVNLVYQAPAAAAEGDGQRLRDELISRGAAIDPEYADVDYHGDAEEFIVRFPTGDPDYETIRVTVTPGSTDVYVNADRSE